MDYEETVRKVMDYEQTISYIHSVHIRKNELGTERIEKLLGLMDNPQNRLKFIHVAGTNGKGSTNTMCAYAMMEAGYNVGLFMSPGTVDFRDRIQFNGEMISKEDVVALTEYVKPFVDRLPDEQKPSWSEVLTAIAFEYYVRKKCDIVCLEVMLGGRRDATNVIQTPTVSVICSISYDHMGILGNTLAKIAAEKAGIIKKEKDAVLYPLQAAEVFEVIKNTCEEKHSPLTIPDLNALTIHKKELFDTRISYKGLDIKVPLLGEHQIYNTVTAVEALFAVRRNGFAITDEQIATGIEKTVVPGRVEVLNDDPLVIVDVGHNFGCAEALAWCLEKLRDEKSRITLVMGMLADKEYDKATGAVAKYADRVAAVTPNGKRALPKEEFAAVAKKYCGDVVMYDEIAGAVKAELAMAKPGEAVVACGSFYVATDARAAILEFFGK